ncbi:MAG TPA: ABC transporter substrate-binding protein [Candidatus Limnocylindrales bacterium]
MRQKRFWAVLLAGALAAPAAACASSSGEGIAINVYYAPENNFATVVDECTKAANGRYHINYQVLPRSADDQRVQLARRLAAGDTGMDVMALDVTWTPEFASAEWILEWTGDDKAAAEAGTLAGPLRTATFNGKLYAAPKNTNTELLWYRKDLVERPPATWDEMIQMAQDLKAKGQTHQVLTMGAQYEGLVVLYNTLVASAGGKILNDDGTRAVMDAGAVRGLQQLQHFASSGVTSPSFTNQIEDDVRLAYQTGGGAFEVNWPFVYAAMLKDAPDMAAKTAWARVPGVDAGTPSRVTIGGYHLAVSAFSRYPQEAFEATLCLRSAEHQKFSAINDGVPPTIEAVYAEPEMEQAYPMRDIILEQLRDAASRPSTPAYQNVSTVLSATLSPPANIRPQQTADELRTTLQNALESKGVLP